jgi:hypothetical protein
MSIGLLITFGTFRYWVGGDVETPTEVKIAAQDLVRDVDVYQLNHHGADNGSSAEFLADLQPTVAIISNGSNSSFRHPRASTLARLAALPSPPAVFQLNKYLPTGDDGANVADSLIADPETTDADGTILVTVGPRATTYTLSFGQTEHEFAIKTAGRPIPVVIASLLPDPTTSSDRLGETVTVRNDGVVPVDLTDWFLRDATGRVWAFTNQGSLAPGQSVTVRRNGMAMSLNNDGDTVELVDTTGTVMDRFSYASSQPGVEIVTGH